MNSPARSAAAPMLPSPPIAPIIPLTVGMIAISFAPILVKYSEAPASIQGMYRMVFTLLLMLPFGLRHLAGIRSVLLKDWALLVLAGVFLGLHFLWWMESIDYTSIASSTLILTLEPVLVMLGSILLFREKFPKSSVSGLVIAIAGIGFVASGDIGISPSAMFGDFLSFLSVLAIAANMLLAKRILTRVSSYVYSLVVFAVSSLFFLGYNAATNTPIAGYPSREWLLFLLLAVVPTVLGHMVFNWLLAYVSAATISISVLAEPVGAGLLGLLLFREILSGFQIVGGLLVITGLVLYLRAQNLREEASASDNKQD